MFCILTVLGFASPGLCQETVVSSISLIRTGWNTDSFSVVTAEPIRNPAHCPEPDGYMSLKSLPGYTTYYAAALTAYAANQTIQIIIHNSECALSRPKLIGINLVR
jgi:hypothetical protein